MATAAGKQQQAQPSPGRSQYQSQQLAQSNLAPSQYQTSYPHQFQSSVAAQANIKRTAFQFSQPGAENQFTAAGQRQQEPQQQMKHPTQQFYPSSQYSKYLQYPTQQQSAAVPQQYKGFAGSSAYLNQFRNQAVGQNEKQNGRQQEAYPQQTADNSRQQEAFQSADSSNIWSILSEAASAIDAMEGTSTDAPVEASTKAFNIDDLLNQVEISLDEIEDKRQENQGIFIYNILIYTLFTQI